MLNMDKAKEALKPYHVKERRTPAMMMKKPQGQKMPPSSPSKIPAMTRQPATMTRPSSSGGTAMTREPATMTRPPGTMTRQPMGKPAPVAGAPKGPMLGRKRSPGVLNPAGKVAFGRAVGLTKKPKASVLMEALKTSAAHRRRTK